MDKTFEVKINSDVVQKMKPFGDMFIGRTSLLRRIKLFTSPGLEKLLMNELSELSPSCKVISGGRSFIDARATLNDIWMIILRSRICEQLWMHICDPFTAKQCKSLRGALNSAEWGNFIPFSVNLQKPYVKALSRNSQLYHTNMIEKIVQEIIKGHCHRSIELQGDELPDIMKKRGCLPLCPRIMLKIENDVCEILANASGDMTDRAWNETFGPESCIKATSVAAIVRKISLERILSEKNVAAIWDPFCHNGSLLMELCSIINGQMIRSRGHVYPLCNFPINSPEKYEEILNSIQDIDPQYTEVSLLGTDPSPECIKNAIKVQKSWSMEIQNLNNPDSPHKNKCIKGPEFVFESMENVPKLLKKFIILTNLYYGDKERRQEFVSGYKEFSKLLKSMKNGDLCGAFVIAPESFIRLSGLNWHTELKFNNNGIKVVLLRLVN